MELSAKTAAVQEILPWRDLYRKEMNCQIVHDSLHLRPGWTQPYLLAADGAAVGYGSVVLGGPWQGKPAVFEVYVLPQCRPLLFDLFAALLAAAGPATAAIVAQSNDPILSVLLHAFAQSVVSGSILFHDQLTTALPSPGALFRRVLPEDAPKVFAHQHEPAGEWALEFEGGIMATGGLMFHYNRPYGDIYMEVAEPLRRRGFGAYLVQELKRVCYEQGSVPSARCHPANLASRGTLQKAGFVPCGHILNGSLKA